jgi:hypothetical protein
VDPAFDVRGSPEPVSKPLKRSRSYISDGGQIILPPPEDRDEYDTPHPPKPETKPLKRIRQTDGADKIQITRPALNEYDTPPPPRLHLDPRQAPQHGVRPRDNGDRKPERPNRVERNGTYLNRARSSGLRRTDDPSDYGLPVARHPRERDYRRGESAGPTHRRNLRRIDRPEDRCPTEPSNRNAGDREQEERQAQERRLAQRERDKRENQQRRDALKRREEREVREERGRREARERVEREEAETRAEEKEERNLGPMEEQMRAFEEREYQRSVKAAQRERKEERRRLRRLEESERHPIVVPERPAKREDSVKRQVGRGSRLSVRGAIIDKTELSD